MCQRQRYFSCLKKIHISRTFSFSKNCFTFVLGNCITKVMQILFWDEKKYFSILYAFVCFGISSCIRYDLLWQSRSAFEIARSRETISFICNSILALFKMNPQMTVIFKVFIGSPKIWKWIWKWLCLHLPTFGLTGKLREFSKLLSLTL